MKSDLTDFNQKSDEKTAEVKRVTQEKTDALEEQERKMAHSEIHVRSLTHAIISRLDVVAVMVLRWIEMETYLPPGPAASCFCPPAANFWGEFALASRLRMLVGEMMVVCSF